MFHPKIFENSRPDGIAVLEVAPNAEGEAGGLRQFVPLRRTELFGIVAGPLADLRVVQTFGYSRAACDRVLEALYRFPLPGDAAVRGVRVRFGDVEIEAELKERAQAQADYDAAKAEGRQAALATRESADVFTLRVAGLKPGQDIVIETRYVQLARPEGSGWSLRVPLTTAPRYVRSDERDSAAAQGQPLAMLRDPGHRFRMEMKIEGAIELRSPTHALKTTASDGGVTVELKEGEVLPDRDCVLTWQAAEKSPGPAFSLFTHGDAQEDALYFLAQVAPPALASSSSGAEGGVAREVTLLVDHSGSMAGAKWEAADWAVERFLGDLSERDSFALAVFHSTTRWFRQSIVKASQKNVADAVTWLKSARDGGGTELGVALEQALRLNKTSGERARHLLIVTDAAVSDSERILRLAEAESASPERRRISVICIDAAPNSYLALELAEQGGGVARFLTSVPEEEDIVTALDEVLADWSAPVLAGLQLGVDRADVDAAGRQVTAARGESRVDLGDLPSGRSIWVAGRAPLAGKQGADFTLRQAKGREIAEAKVVAGEFPALKALFGARKINALEHLIGAGYHGEELLKRLERLGYSQESLAAAQTGSAPLYAENVRVEAKAQAGALLARESLRYGLASSATGFVAVRREAGKKVEGTAVVANALPAGWSDEFVGGVGVGAMAMPSFAVMQSLMPSAPRGRSMGRMLHSVAESARDLFSAPKMQAALSPALPPLGQEKEYAGPRECEVVVFTGKVNFQGEQAILFDSAASPSALAERGRITGLVLLRGLKAGTSPGRGATLLIYVGDLAQPRARVRIADLVRQGERPLNLARSSGDVVRIVLDAPADEQANLALLELRLKYVA